MERPGLQKEHRNAKSQILRMVPDEPPPVGLDLATLMSRTHLPERVLCELGALLAGRLAELHTAPVPIVHGELRASNIVISPEGKVFLTQAPAANAVESKRELPPEQLAGKILPEGDIYAMGVILGEAMVAEAEDGPGADPDLVELVSVCLSERPEDRPKAGELEEALRTVSWKAVGPELGAWVAMQMAEEIEDPGTLIQETRTDRWMWRIGAALLGLVVVLEGGAYAFNQRMNSIERAAEAAAYVQLQSVLPLLNPATELKVSPKARH